MYRPWFKSPPAVGSQACNSWFILRKRGSISPNFPSFLKTISENFHALPAEQGKDSPEKSATFEANLFCQAYTLAFRTKISDQIGIGAPPKLFLCDRTLLLFA